MLPTQVNLAVDGLVNLEALGQVLPARRDKVFLVTKCWTDSGARAQQMFEESLRTLKTDHVDLVHIHNVGLQLDSWHWYTSHGTVDEMLRLSNRAIVHVHVNDAPAGVAVDEQVDNRRKLPVTTGVIDLKGFMNALVKIGYDGPVECEPFDQGLRDMEDEAAVQTTAAALQRLWDLIET